MENLVDQLAPVAVLLTIVTGGWFLRDKIFGWFRGAESINEHDVALYEKYKGLFVDNGVAEFCLSHDFLGSFLESNWRPLSEYADNWHRVEYQFVDKRLNRAHTKVYKRAYALAIAISKYTVPIGKQGNVRSVKSDRLPIGPTPPEILAQATEINRLKPGFAKAHMKFVRLANSRLQKRMQG